MFPNHNLYFDKTLSCWFLEVEVENFKDFLESIKCDECHKQIRDDIYFCKDGKVFYDKQCILNGKHENKFFKRANHYEHEDYKVIVLNGIKKDDD